MCVTDDYRMDVQVFDLQGNFIRKWGGAGTADSLFDHPDGITYDGDGNIWVADRFNNALRGFDAEGNHLFTPDGDTNFLIKVFAYTTDVEPTTWGRLKSRSR